MKKVIEGICDEIFGTVMAIGGAVIYIFVLLLSPIWIIPYLIDKYKKERRD